MSDEELNRKLAELLGWSDLYEPYPGKWRGRNPDLPENCHYQDYIPNYCGNLNAVLAVTKTLGERHVEYLTNLCDVLGITPLIDIEWDEIWTLVDSTPKQRTEALIKTLEEK